MEEGKWYLPHKDTLQLMPFVPSIPGIEISFEDGKWHWKAPMLVVEIRGIVMSIGDGKLYGKAKYQAEDRERRIASRRTADGL